MIKRRSATLSGGLLFVLSFGYLLAELFFNISLLDVAGDIKSPTEKIEDIQVLGRAISAFGMLLLVAGFVDIRRFRSLKPRAQAAVVTVLGFLALFLLFAPFFNPNLRYGTADSIAGFIAFLGALTLLASQFRFRKVAAALGIVMIAGPAVFLGQKIMIEQFMVDRTDWQSRVNARYVLMLRAGFEGCTIFLQDMNLCDTTPDKQSAVKSARIITSALWTLYPAGIYKDIIENRDSLIIRVALAETADSLDRDYQAYLDGIEKQIAKFDDEIAKYQQMIVEKYYIPYAQASKAYFTATTPDDLYAEASRAADEIDARIEQGWQKYLTARDVQQNRQFKASDLMNRTHKRLAAYFGGAVREYCAGSNCPTAQVEKIAQNAKARAAEAFEQKTGYAPDLSRAEFVASAATQNTIREAVERRIQSVSDNSEFSLPPGWRYSRYSFIEMFRSIYQQEAVSAWNARTGGRLPPGLSQDEFFAALGIEPLPQISLESLNVMSREQFFHDIVLSYYKENALSEIDAIEAEKHLYGENQSMAEKGRNYVRAVYIPAIALVVSLFVVSITLLRGWLACVIWGLKKMRAKVPLSAYRGLRAGVIAASVLVFVLIPYSQPNEYATGRLYKQYLRGAAEDYPVMAYTLDWALHIQPLIYQTGNIFRSGF